jgi:hypothetical protein
VGGVASSLALRYPRGVRFLTMLLLLAAVPLAGCINTDTAIFVAPTISAPEADVMLAADMLGSTLTGGFHLDLHLGARASGSSTVSIIDFSIVDAQQQGAIVPTLNVTSSTPFPATVQQDSDVNADFTFGSGTAFLTPDAKTGLCAAAGVIIEGSFRDSLESGTSTTPAASPVFHPDGCM